MVSKFISPDGENSRRSHLDMFCSNEYALHFIKCRLYITQYSITTIDLGTMAD